MSKAVTVDFSMADSIMVLAMTVALGLCSMALNRIADVAEAIQGAHNVSTTTEETCSDKN